jgi:hypothetical protein
VVAAKTSSPRFIGARDADAIWRAILHLRRILQRGIDRCWQSWLESLDVLCRGDLASCSVDGHGVVETMLQRQHVTLGGVQVEQGE